MHLSEIPTPALILDLDRLERNLDWMAARCKTLGVTLRPHVKTHKCVEIGRMQMERGATGVTVSTLFEANAFANHGFSDITWAFPLIPGRVREVRELAERVRLGVVVDTEEAVHALVASGGSFEVWIKVDCGYHRAGVDPESEHAVGLADRIQRAERLSLRGVLSHSGHAYDTSVQNERAAIAEAERAVMVGFAQRLMARGASNALEISVGSTPSMKSVGALDGVTEARPGNYALYDTFQAHLGTCAPADIAVSVLSTVVSSQPGASHCILDAGALALSRDPGVDDPGSPCFGEIVDDYEAGTTRADAWISGLSQEHGKLNMPLPAGSRVRVLPNHSCVTVACFDQVFAVQGEEVLDRWTVHRGRD